MGPEMGSRARDVKPDASLANGGSFGCCEAAGRRGGKIQVRMAGFGGQGIVLAGMILGKAAALYEKSNAVMTQSYGPEARGGACSADIVVSPRRIDYPRVTEPDVLVLMSEEASRTYGENSAEGAMVLVNENLVKTLPAKRGLRVYKIPATAIAEKLARALHVKTLAANIVMLGFVAAVAGVVSFESVKKAVLDSIPKGSEGLNTAALEEGYAYGLALTGGAGGTLKRGNTETAVRRSDGALP